MVPSLVLGVNELTPPINDHLFCVCAQVKSWCVAST